MHRTTTLRLVLLPLLLLSLALVAAACGGDDDDSGGDDSATSTPADGANADDPNGGDDGNGGDEPTATTDEDNGDDEPTATTEEDDNGDDGPPSGSGSDEQYARSVCEAFGGFFDSFQEFITDSISSGEEPDEQDFVDALLEPVNETIDRLEDVNPPGDIAEFHEALLDGYRALRDALESGDFASLEDLDQLDNLPEPPQDVQDRIEAVAAEIPECVETGLFTND